MHKQLAVAISSSNSYLSFALFYHARRVISMMAKEPKVRAPTFRDKGGTSFFALRWAGKGGNL